MHLSARPIIGLLIYSSFILSPASFARADGGAIRLRERAGNYQIAVFTSPTPFRAGPVDVSVLVQDAASRDLALEARVTIRLTAQGARQTLEYACTTDAATNKLFKAAVFQLPAAGQWDVEVVVDGPHGQTGVRFDVDAAEQLPRWFELWPWFTWPAIVVALFSIHQALARRRAGELLWISELGISKLELEGETFPRSNYENGHC
jgi:hypothetical protein